MKLENSETLKCLINAFAGESQARGILFMLKRRKKKDMNK